MQPITTWGYRAHWAIYNSCHGGLPQNNFHNLELLHPTLCLSLEDILEPLHDSMTRVSTPRAPLPRPK